MDDAEELESKAATAAAAAAAAAGDDDPSSPSDSNVEMEGKTAYDKEESKQFNRERRLSIAFGDAGNFLSAMAEGVLQKVSLNVELSPVALMKLAITFIQTIQAGSDTVGDLTTWFDKKFPNGDIPGVDNKAQQKNLKNFLCQLGKKLRPMCKMARIGLSIKLVISLVLSYFDLITDGLVSKAFFDSGSTRWGITTLSIILVGMGYQVSLTYLQYKRRPWKEVLTKCLRAAFGLAPIYEGFQVWTGASIDSKDLLLDSAIMLACLKGGEIAIESIPESSVQMKAILSMSLVAVSTLMWFSLFSSFASGGFIMTEGNFGFIRTKQLEQPENPIYQWIPADSIKLAKSMFGMFLFSTAFFFLFTFQTAVLWHATGSAAAPALIFGVESLVMAMYKGSQGELFGTAIIKDPGFVNIMTGMFSVPFFNLLTCTAPMMIANHPNEMGPEVFTFVICWRVLISPAILYYSVTKIVEDQSSWLTFPMTLGAFMVAMLLCVFGMWLFLNNVDEDFDKSILWRPKTGKQLAADCFADEKIWSKNFVTKDDEKWGDVSETNPMYVPKGLACEFVEERALKFAMKERGVEKKEGEEKVKEGGEKRPEWLTEEKLGKRVVMIFKWYGDKDMIKRTNVSLDKLFGEGWGGGGEVGNGNKVAPA